MADIWIRRYKELRSAWVAARGVGAQGKSGQLPKMLAGDGLALIAPFTEAVWRLAKRWNRLVDDPYIVRRYGKEKAAEVLAHRDYTLGIETDFEAVPLTEWLMKGEPREGHAAQRRLRNKWFELDTHPDHREAWKALMASWQGAVGLSASTLKYGPLRPLAAHEVIALWSQTFRICTALDVGGEIYPEGDWERFKGAVQHAAREAGGAAREITVEAAEVAGRVVAHVAETAGEAAGKGVSGFFAEAGLTAIVVTAGALYIALT